MDLNQLCKDLMKLATPLASSESLNPDLNHRWQAYTACSCTAAAIRKKFSGIVSTTKAKCKEEVDTKWNEWKEKSVAGCTSGAHRFSRVPHEWKPPEVFRKDGTRAESTAEILDIEAARYKAMWDASDEPEPISYQDNYPRPKLEPDRIRRVAKTFKRRAGVAPDEWHPRYIALLSNEALEVLATLCLLL